jgi:hypothetical protein
MKKCMKNLWTLACLIRNVNFQCKAFKWENIILYIYRRYLWEGEDAIDPDLLALLTVEEREPSILVVFDNRLSLIPPPRIGRNSSSLSSVKVQSHCQDCYGTSNGGIVILGCAIASQTSHCGGPGSIPHQFTSGISDKHFWHWGRFSPCISVSRQFSFHRTLQFSHISSRARKIDHLWPTYQGTQSHPILRIMIIKDYRPIYI